MKPVLVFVLYQFCISLFISLRFSLTNPSTLSLHGPDLGTYPNKAREYSTQAKPENARFFWLILKPIFRAWVKPLDYKSKCIQLKMLDILIIDFKTGKGGVKIKSRIQKHKEFFKILNLQQIICFINSIFYLIIILTTIKIENFDQKLKILIKNLNT